MPFIYRAINRFQHPTSILEHVKHEAVSPLEEESSLLSIEENHLEENRQVTEGRWNEQQNFKFTIFVHYYQDIFASRHKRKVCKIFRIFSEYLNERTSAQCRSHYQKMVLKHKTIAKLKKHYKLMFGEKAYNQEFQRFKLQWESTHPPTLKTSEEIKQCKEIAIQTEVELNPPICENCSAVKSESELASTPSYNPYAYWGDLTQFQSSPGLSFYYWLPQGSN